MLPDHVNVYHINGWAYIVEVAMDRREELSRRRMYDCISNCTRTLVCARTDIVYSQIHVDLLATPTALSSKPVQERTRWRAIRMLCATQPLRLIYLEIRYDTRWKFISLSARQNWSNLPANFISLSRSERQTRGSTSIKLVFKSVRTLNIQLHGLSCSSLFNVRKSVALGVS